VTNLKLVFRSPGGRCHGNQFLLVLSTELIVVTPAASGTAGRANAGLCRLHLVIGLWLPMQQDLLSVDMYLSHRVCLSPLLGWALLAYLLTCRLTCYL